MLGKLSRLALLLVMPLMLFGCVLSPGKFVSTMTINADRTFSFSYKGEVIALNMGKEFGKNLGGFGTSDTSDGSSEGKKPLSLADDQVVGMADIESKTGTIESAETVLTNQAIAATLSKEYGYRSVRYLGKGKFDVDYAVSGGLTHNFTFPFNIDAEAVFPFVAVELRQGGLIRVKAPGFSNDGAKFDKAMSGNVGASPSALNGVFTVNTDAEIVSQNNEDGAASNGARKSIAWKVTPLTKDPPTAVLRLAR